jgi:hypothetical protein
MICDSLMNNDGVMRASSVIKYIPDQSVVGSTSLSGFG